MVGGWYTISGTNPSFVCAGGGQRRGMDADVDKGRSSSSSFADSIQWMMGGGARIPSGGAAAVSKSPPRIKEARKGKGGSGKA